MNVKELKTQLVSATLMLCVATIALGTSTYAWFVSNATVTAGTVAAQAASSQLLLISDDGNQYSTMTSIAALTQSYKLTPVSAGENYLTENSGNTDKTVGARFYKVDSWASGSTSDANPYGVMANTYIPANSGQDYIRSDIWLKSDIDCSLYLDIQTTIQSGDSLNNLSTEADSLYALRIALVDDNSEAIVLAPYALDSHPENGSYYNTSNSYIVSGNGTNINTDVTLQNVVETVSGSNVYRLADTNGTATDIATTITDYQATAFGENMSSSAIEGKTSICTLVKDIPKHFQIYIYLEGCDKDCVSGIAADQYYSILLGFTSFVTVGG